MELSSGKTLSLGYLSFSLYTYLSFLAFLTGCFLCGHHEFGWVSTGLSRKSSVDCCC